MSDCTRLERQTAFVLTAGTERLYLFDAGLDRSDSHHNHFFVLVLPGEMGKFAAGRTDCVDFTGR